MYLGSSYSGGGGGSWVIGVIGVICGGIVLGGLYHLCKKHDVVNSVNGWREGSIPCYLCLSEVRNSQWDSGAHRRSCATSHARQLAVMSRHPTKKCPQCHELLRLWPRQGHPFYCDNNRNCNSGGSIIVNTGINRYNCFSCDIDFCLPCIEREGPPPPTPSGICHLCLNTFTQSGDYDERVFGIHRRQCAVTMAPMLDYFVQAYLKCPKCKKHMKRWPKQGPAFCCTNQNCQNHRSPLENNGTNRYLCFVCDYNLCGSCMEKRCPSGTSVLIEREVTHPPPLAPTAPPPPTFGEMQPFLPPSYEDAVSDVTFESNGQKWRNVKIEIL